MGLVGGVGNFVFGSGFVHCYFCYFIVFINVLPWPVAGRD